MTHHGPGNDDDNDEAPIVGAPAALPAPPPMAGVGQPSPELLALQAQIKALEEANKLAELKVLYKEKYDNWANRNKLFILDPQAGITTLQSQKKALEDQDVKNTAKFNEKMLELARLSQEFAENAEMINAAIQAGVALGGFDAELAACQTNIDKQAQALQADAESKRQDLAQQISQLGTQIKSLQQDINKERPKVLALKRLADAFPDSVKPKKPKVQDNQAGDNQGVKPIDVDAFFQRMRGADLINLKRFIEADAGESVLSPTDEAVIDFFADNNLDVPAEEMRQVFVDEHHSPVSDLEAMRRYRELVEGKKMQYGRMFPGLVFNEAYMMMVVTGYLRRDDGNYYTKADFQNPLQNTHFDPKRKALFEFRLQQFYAANPELKANAAARKIPLNANAELDVEALVNQVNIAKAGGAAEGAREFGAKPPAVDAKPAAKLAPNKKAAVKQPPVDDAPALPVKKGRVKVAADDDNDASLSESSDSSEEMQNRPGHNLAEKFTPADADAERARRDERARKKHGRVIQDAKAQADIMRAAAMAAEAKPMGNLNLSQPLLIAQLQARLKPLASAVDKGEAVLKSDTRRSPSPTDPSEDTIDKAKRVVGELADKVVDQRDKLRQQQVHINRQQKALAQKEAELESPAQILKKFEIQGLEKARQAYLKLYKREPSGGEMRTLFKQNTGHLTPDEASAIIKKFGR